MTEERNQRKVYQGRVVSDKMDKKPLQFLLKQRKTTLSMANA